jgi:CBS domain-containing protein
MPFGQISYFQMIFVIVMLCVTLFLCSQNALIMDFNAPVSQYMTKNLITVHPEDNVDAVHAAFEKHAIHHLPVVRDHHIEGIISKRDLALFTRWIPTSESEKLLEDTRMRNYKAKEIMTTRMAKVDPTDRMNVVLEVFKINRFHALPVVDGDRLVGIITTHDIITALLAEDPVKPVF